MKVFERTYQFVKSIFVMDKLGIGTVQPTKELDVNGSVRIRSIVNDNSQNRFLVVDNDGNILGRTYLHILPIKTIDNHYSVQYDDHTILIKNSDTWNINLPDATTYKGIIYNFKFLETTSMLSMVYATNNQTIDGGTGPIILSPSKTYVRVQSDGTNWHTLNS